MNIKFGKTGVILYCIYS